MGTVGSILLLAGCGGGDDSAADSIPGTVSEPWTSFCTGTFSEDTEIIGAFGDPTFTARAGEEYLLLDFDDSSGARAEFAYMTSAGPDSFEVEPDQDESFPFTSNCAIGEGLPYYAVFKDVIVFEDKELTTKICELNAGSVLPAGGEGRGFGFAGSAQGAAVYELILGPFSEQCEAQGSGYISVPHTTSFGSSTFLVPVIGIIGPE